MSDFLFKNIEEYMFVYRNLLLISYVVIKIKGVKEELRIVLGMMEVVVLFY